MSALSGISGDSEQKFILQTIDCLIKYKILEIHLPGISTSKNLLKEIESVNSNSPGISISFE